MRSCVVCLLLVLAACGAPQANVPGHDTSYAQMAGTGVAPGPPDFQAGYADGCGSGNADAGFRQARGVRDWNQYQKNAIYKQGWDEGHATCFASFTAFRNQK
jgi:hypothetical protein